MQRRLGLMSPLYGLFAQNSYLVVVRLQFHLNAQRELQRHGSDETENQVADRPINATSGHAPALTVVKVCRRNLVVDTLMLKIAEFACIKPQITDDPDVEDEGFSPSVLEPGH
ncbi:MAG: hypothetical protein OXI33_05295 [Chloroflexota bacterium]|nr:hypothetical protein [Chloroflexota bacterium]